MWGTPQGRLCPPYQLHRLTTVIASQRVGAKRRPMTGSATQSIAPRGEKMACFVADAPRNYADGHEHAFSRRDSPEVCPDLSRLEIRGRRECRMRAAPAVPCA